MHLCLPKLPLFLAFIMKREELKAARLLFLWEVLVFLDHFVPMKTQKTENILEHLNLYSRTILLLYLHSIHNNRILVSKNNNKVT